MLSLPAFAAFSQDRPIGYWRSHTSFANAYGVVTDGTNLFAFSTNGFFTYSTIDGATVTYSKVDGMHDIGVSQVGYDATTQTVIVAYSSSNIDLFQDESFYNIPALKDKSYNGAKTINHIYTEDGIAYLSTNLGIMAINLKKKEVKETYVFTKNSQTIAINAFGAAGNYFYAATTKGLYRGIKTNPNLAAFASWQALDTSHNFTSLAVVQDNVFVTGTDTLYRYTGSGLQYVYNTSSTSGITTHIDAGNKELFLSVNFPTLGYGRVKQIDMNNNIIASFQLGPPQQVAQGADGRIYVADKFQGVARLEDSIHQHFIVPIGPPTDLGFGLWVNNKELYEAHGGYDEKYAQTGNFYGYSQFTGDYWVHHGAGTDPLFTDSVTDFVDILKDPATGNVYIGSMGSGLIVLSPDGKETLIGKGILEHQVDNEFLYPANGLALDAAGNLWVNQMSCAHELAMMTRDGKWYHFGTSYPRRLQHASAGVIVDDYNQKWFYAPGGNGVIVYNDGGTPDNTSDDASAWLQVGKGAGNLPSNTVYCLAKDRDGAVWIGTSAGIGIVNCPGDIINGFTSCETTIPVVQYDQFPNYLFVNDQVVSIAIDGANRKWVGTNTGVWLISPDAQKAVYHFTAENSPLPSDRIRKIAVDGVTGDVYIATENGLISFRSTATDGSTAGSNITVFPNPVSSGYTGPIAIKGLTEDADVRITDIAGQLIFRTKALGGQAIWTGVDYTGHRPASGVYLLFVSNKDGSQVNVGKMMFMN